MKKIDPTILKETLYILAVTVIMSVLMESVFLIIDKWDLAVLFGNLLGMSAAVGNFFVMGLTVQSALGKEAKDAKNTMRLSQMGRMLALFLIAVGGYIGSRYGIFNIVAVVVPYIFPRFAITVRPLISRKKGEPKNE